MNSKITVNNPLGILAIDHLEFTCDDLGSKTRELFYTFGFEKTYEHKPTNSELFTQGQVRFLLTANTDPNSHARKYFQRHGEGVSKMSFLVENAEYAFTEAIKRGAKQVEELKIIESEHGTFKRAVIQGFGDVTNEFIERPASYFRPCFTKLASDSNARPLSTRVARIDHLTNNVPKGEMKKWVEFYERVYGFKVTKYFDIKGIKTGLQSEVVQLGDGTVIIPINEPDAEQSKSQIQEFLDLHKGPGVQHVALTTSNIINTIGDLQDRDIQFLDIPHTYYEDISKRGIHITEDVNVLEERKLLVDGDKEGYLLQIFTETYIGPLFFEFIQRKNNDGFGEGNFQALFDAIERDQLKRGYL
ncbi:MAG: 4-hydroxyphenylpyruvate dioxygenase [Halobacteriovoraceae bacterium]|nr:4-hydroxyphenylpyruvate dioxygenase [Halobacteriovoraceae bacterium]